MRSQSFGGVGGRFQEATASDSLPSVAKQATVSTILVIAMLAFELFNFDTTRFALHSLLGDASFGGIRWAAILALAFCAIDFAGLVHLCGPEREHEARHATWYLTGAWLLAGTMNALMTWWAINLTLLNHAFGNELLSRAQILEVVPPFVAGLVWLTRILFIGAFALNGNSAASDEPALWSGGLAQRRPAAPDRSARSSLSSPVRRTTGQIAHSQPVSRPPLPSMMGARSQGR